jgi:hypothetical protein
LAQLDITRGNIMADIIVRRLDERVKDELKQRARRHGRSLESEAREILRAATDTPEPEGETPLPGESFGELMLQRFGKRGLTRIEAARFKAGMREINSAWEAGLPDFFE